jgi:hypothetical protein
VFDLLQSRLPWFREAWTRDEMSARGSELNAALDSLLVRVHSAEAASDFRQLERVSATGFPHSMQVLRPTLVWWCVGGCVCVCVCV